MTLLYAYNFDEASGNILDATGNGRTTTLAGALTRTSSGAGHTDKGMSQNTTAGDSNGPSLTGLQTSEFTVMAWVKRSTNALDGWFCEIKDAGSGDRGILFLGGAVQARARNSGGTVANVSTTQPTAGTFYHVAGSYSTTDSKVHLYINGTEVGTGTALTGPLKTTSTGSHLFDSLGSETIIDDVRYYDQALSAATITTLMGTPVSSGGSSVTGTVTADFGMTATVVGVPTVTGTIAFNINSTFTAVGFKQVTATATADAGATATVVGLRTSLGQAATDSGFTATVVGSGAGVNVDGVTQTNVGFTATLVGLRETVAQITADFGSSATVLGVRTTFGVAAMSSGFFATATDGVSSMAIDGHTLTYHMNRKAGTIVNGVPQLPATAAANVWAGTTGLELVHALNVKAGNTLPNYRELAGVLNQLASTSGLEVDGAAASIP